MNRVNSKYGKNINKFLSFFLAFMMIFSIVFSVPVFAEERQVNPGSDFEFNNGIITGYSGTTKDVVIPDKINGETVTAIGANAFRGKNLNSIVIPDTIKSIGMQAFAMNSLTSIELPHTLMEMGNMAFFNNNIINVKIPETLDNIPTGAFFNNELTSVTIPEGVKWIGMSAFNGNKLSLVTIPKSVENIGNKAFDKNYNINLRYSKLIEAIENAKRVEKDGKSKEKIQMLQEAIKEAEELNTKSMATLEEVNEVVEAINKVIKALKEEKPEEPEKPEFPEDEFWEVEDFTYEGTSVTGFSEIGKEKFKKNKHVVLPKVNEFGESIIEIGDKAFLGKESTKQNPEIGINSVVIPETVTTIGEEAFRYNCLTKIDIPNSVVTIKMLAFNSNKLESLVIPNSVTKVEGGGFTFNEISSLKLSNSLETIETAFGFNNLTTVTIPEGVTKICDLAFSDNQLTEVKLPSTIKYLSGFNNNDFKSIEIPKSVEELGKRAFARNKITSVTIPGNVKVVGENAFWNTWHDDYLHSVIIEEGVEKIGKGAFNGNDLTDVELPSSVNELHENAFAKNIGYDGIIHLYTPEYKNLNNLQESRHHVINPAKLTIRYKFEDKVLKEEETWKYPETEEYFHIGDKDVEIVPRYEDNEYELKDKNLIKVNLEDRVNEIIVECKKKEIVEEVKLKSIGKVAPVVVESGTAKTIVMNKLATKTYIIDSNDKEHEVELSWILDEYDGNKTGEYEAIGTFELPRGVIQSEPETKLEVVGKIIVKEKVENPEDNIWEIKDFTYEGTIITGFSEAGKEKLKRDKDLVLPKENKNGETITHIAGESFENMGLTSLIIPESLDGLIIGQSAFQNNEIARVIIPEGVKEIDTYAFSNNEIRYIDFPGTLKKIGNHAFANNKMISAMFSEDIEGIALDNYSFINNELTTVTIIKEVKKIAPNAFKDNTGHGNDDNKVHVYTVNEENKWFDVSDHFRIIMLDAESVEEIESIKVNIGTEIEEIKLPEKIILNLNNGDKKEVDVTWINEVYNADKIGEYRFKGVYDLPYGMTGEKPEASLKVVVKEGAKVDKSKDSKEPQEPGQPEQLEQQEEPEKSEKQEGIEKLKEKEEHKEEAGVNESLPKTGSVATPWVLVSLIGAVMIALGWKIRR